MTLQFVVKHLGVGLVWLAAAGIAAVTILPLSDSNIWWIRTWDFPRVQIAVVAGLVTLVALCISGPTRVLVPAIMAAVACYQIARIFPYTVLATPEMQLAAPKAGDVRVLSANVLMENDRYDLMLDRIDSFDPDVLLLMETDQAWVDAMEPALSRYDTVIRQPQDNYYGMIFATRLTASEARIIHLTGDETPSIFAQLTTEQGVDFRFVGLHPRPPTPGTDTVERDRQIYYAARFAASSNMPLVVTGDFNDVAWSDTSRSFKHVGQYLDPRIGRGLYSSFDATRWWLRFPIDQLYVTPDVAVSSLQRLDPVGSDHFPMAARLNLDATLASTLNTTPEPISEEEMRLVEQAVSDMRDKLGHERISTPTGKATGD